MHIVNRQNVDTRSGLDDSRNGFTCCFQVYTGKVGDTLENIVAARVVMDVSNDILDKGFCLYFDNYYSSASLLSDKRYLPYWYSASTQETFS